MNRQDLERIFRQAWTRQTSALPEKWTLEVPSIGQCLHTSWIARYYLGGEVIRVIVPGQHFFHFFNLTADGDRIDFTEAQLRIFNVTWTREHETVFTPALFQQYCEDEKVNQRYNLMMRNFMEQVYPIA